MNDIQFKKNIHNTLLEYLDEKQENIKNKKIIDIGAGSGRFSYGFLSLGAEVTAIEPTKGGCEQIIINCKEFSDKLKVLQKNLLFDELPNNFDIVFCFGVVHHTGNTYLAIKKAIDCAKQGAKVFFMIYGYPITKDEFYEINIYEYWRQKLRHKNFSEKIEELEKKFPKNLVHCYFDATSPKENDLLRYEEAYEFLKYLGIHNIKRTINNRNLFIVGYKK